MKKTINTIITVETTTVISETIKNAALGCASKASLWERATIENAIKFMERTGNVSYAVEIPFKFLSVSNIQRSLNRGQVNKIKRKFNPLLVEYLIVNYNPTNGKWEILDGQHTAVALSELGYTSAMCKLFIGLTQEEKVLVFTSQYRKKTKITSKDEHNVYLCAGMEPAVSIAKTLKQYNVTLCEGKKNFRNITSVRKVYRIVKDYGVECLAYCCKLIQDAGWGNDGKGFIEAALNLGHLTYTICANDKVNYNLLISHLDQYDTVTEFINQVRFKYTEVSAKHPEDAIPYYVNDLLGN